MKNLLTACVPALALLVLGGCASTSGLTSTEDDGVYYSSKDRTTAVVSTAPAPTSSNEATNPDYHGDASSATGGRNQGSGSSQYYDNSYSYMKGVPGYGSSATYSGPGLSYYAPYSPYTSLSYGYGWGGGACGFSPYAYGGYDPFYSSFYSPFGYGYSPYYGYGSGLSISFGFGRPWGYGGYGYGYSPYSYYGGFYDPYYYNSPFYGGYYGRGGYYGSSYYGGAYGYGTYYSRDSRTGAGRTYGHRTDRASDGRYTSGNGTTTGTTSPTTSGGRVRTSGLLAPNSSTTMPQSSGVVAAPAESRTREVTTTGRERANMPASADGAYNQPQRMDRAEQPQYRNMEPASTGRAAQLPDATMGQGQATRDDSRSRWRTAEAAPQNNQTQSQEMANPQEGRRRGGFFQNVFSQPSGGQATEQTRQRSYDQMQQRTYEQPQRSYEQPQRSYSQPSYSSPSYSAPSCGGGGGGGGGGHGRGPR